MSKNAERAPRTRFPPRMKNAAYIALIIGIAMALETFVLAYRPPRNALLPDPFVVVERDGEFVGTRETPVLISSGKDASFISGNYVFRFTVSIPGDVPEDAKKVLVFPQVGGNSLEVTFNGVPIGVRGDPVSGRSSIWNAVHVFHVPSGLVVGGNVIEARIAGTYEAGIISEPYLIDDGDHALRLFFLMFFSNYAIWISIGSIVAVSLIVLSMGFFDITSRYANILLGLAGLAVAVFLADFVYIEGLPISIVAFKKLVVASRHLSAALFMIAYLKLLGRKLDPFAIVLSVVQILCFILVIVYPGTIVDIKRLYGYTYLTFLPFQLYLLVIIFRSAIRDRSLRIMVFGVVVAFLSASRDIVFLVLVKSDGSIMISHFGFIVLSLSSCAFVVSDSLKHYSALVVERRRAAVFREESLHDELTGCYNRKIFPVLTGNLERPFAVLVFDIDGFKSINDEFGHATGDAILVDLVRLANRNIRAYDCVARTGGDEFLLILRSCSLEVACAVAERLVADCRRARVPVVGDQAPASDTLRFATYSISVGVALCAGGSATTSKDFFAVQRAADAEMYRAKNSGKNRWCSEGEERALSLA